MFKQHKGFTLAEVLITLTIIGVVAAITVPVIQKSFQDSSLKTGFKKSYSNIYQAFDKVTSENGQSYYNCHGTQLSTYDTSDCTSFWTAFKSQLNIIKEYTGAVDGKNIPDYTGTDLIEAQGGHNNNTCTIGQVFRKNQKTAWTLSDGSMLISGIDVFPAAGAGQYFILDTNGLKKPNKWGYDLFILNFFKKDASSPVTINDAICGSQEKDGYNISDILSK